MQASQVRVFKQVGGPLTCSSFFFAGGSYVTSLSEHSFFACGELCICQIYYKFSFRIMLIGLLTLVGLLILYQTKWLYSTIKYSEQLRPRVNTKQILLENRI